MDRLHWKVHPWPLGALVRTRLLRSIDGLKFDMAFVDGGSLVSGALIGDLRERGMHVVNFNHDDPFGPRDGAYFELYRRAVPQYDLLVVVRHENVAEARALGARRVMHTFRVADDVAHSPRIMTPELRARWQSQVAFVGTWMPERGPFLARLVELNVPLAIFGGRWQLAPQAPVLRPAWRGNSLQGDDYCYAVQAARICLGLVSKENRDLHTTRSLEIPSLGSLLCGQRTPEHNALYTEGEEAVFWDDADECAAVCRELLADEARREAIARKGQERFRANGHTTDQLLSRIINETFA